MKRGLSTGDITNTAAGDGASNRVIKPVRSRRKKVGYIQPLLVGLQSTDDVSLIMAHAKSLRRTLVQLVRENVFINRNLTKIEGQLAYEERCRRRQRRQTQTNAAANSHQADQSVSFVNSDSTSTQPIAVLNTCGGGVTTPASAAVEPISNDLPTDSDRGIFGWCN